MMTSARSGLSAPVSNEVTFLSGVNPDGTVAAESLHTLVYSGGTATNPPVYRTMSFASKWGSPVAGTTGGTAYYYFEPSANWTAGEQSALTSGLDLWAAVADIHFVQTTATAVGTGSGAETVFDHQPQLTFSRGAPGSGSYEAAAATARATTVGSSMLGSQVSTGIAIATSDYGFGPLGSFSTAGGYPVDTVLHEEGHMLGLGHGGPYDGTTDPATQQYGVYDSRQWSLMSYINPDDTTAKYAANDQSVTGVSGTNWNGNSPTTPMPLDILAVQRLYGVPVTTPLSGGNVFGFHCNIAGDIEPFFDFSKNASPVVTLWDKGGGNTLDVSGFAGDSTIDLNPGTFSSCDGMTNNVGIAFGTAIDTAVGGAGTNTFIVNGDADTIDGNGRANTVDFAGVMASYGISRTASLVKVTDLGSNVTDTLNDVQTLHFADRVMQASSIACYASGTRIATPEGETEIGRLAIGDQVLTASGVVRRIRWIGRRSYAGRVAARMPDVLPVLIRAGALADGVPRRDLAVSPLHAMGIDGMLIPAVALLNGRSILQQDVPGRIDYVHVELDTHDLLLAEGAASESFVDDDSREMFDNAADYARRYPDAVRAPARYCAPRIDSGHVLAAVRHRLAVRAGLDASTAPEQLRGAVDRVGAEEVSGWAQHPLRPDVPVCLDIVLDGRVVAQALAARPRPDLAAAGLGSGRHGFRARLPAALAPRELPRVVVCRSADRAVLPRSP